MAVSDETKLHDTPLLHLAEPRSEDARIADRYQQQLGLPLSTLARLLGPQFVQERGLDRLGHVLPHRDRHRGRV